MAKDEFDADFNFEEEYGFDPNEFLDSDADADIDFSEFTMEESGSDGSDESSEIWGTMTFPGSFPRRMRSLRRKSLSSRHSRIFRFALRVFPERIPMRTRISMMPISTILTLRKRCTKDPLVPWNDPGSPRSPKRLRGVRRNPRNPRNPLTDLPGAAADRMSGNVKNRRR